MSLPITFAPVRVHHTLYGPGVFLRVLAEVGHAWVKFDGNGAFVGGKRRVLASDFIPVMADEAANDAVPS
jgi:hypothetical protein